MKKTLSAILLLALLCAMLPSMSAYAAVDSIEIPVPEEGEVLYIGTAEYDVAGSFTMAFLLCADGLEIREITILMEDVDLVVTQRTGSMKLGISSAQSRFPSTYAIQPDGSVNAGDILLRDVVMEEDRIMATLHYTYNYYSSGSSTKIPFGTSEIVFEKQA